MDNFKLKLKNILHSTQFCGLCLENDSNMNAIDEELKIIDSQQSDTKILKDIVDVVFKDASNILLNSEICNNCTEKLMKSYMFIENAKKISQVISNYINDLFSKSNDILNHLIDSGMESSNVVIVLENNKCVSSEHNIGNKKLKGKFATIVAIKNEDDPVEKRTKLKNKCSKFKCVKCNVVLSSYRELKIHKPRCKTQMQVECRICFKTFKNKHYLNAHYKVHSKVKCKVCNEIINYNELLVHYKTFHSDLLHQCSKCDDVFYSLKKFKIHEKICLLNKEDTQQCLMCLKNFTKDKFRIHNCKFQCPECSEIPCMHYKYLINYREQILNQSNKAKCLDCGYVCRKKENLLGHVNREHLNYHPYTCDKCGQQFYSKVVLKAHIYRFHEDCFVCQFCDSEFNTVYNYEIHLKSCEDIKRKYVCDDCPASFVSLEYLMKHKKRRHSKVMFPCALCNKVFLKDSETKEHTVKVHSGHQMKTKVFNLQCVLCEEKFDSKGELVEHMNSHGPNIKYPCKVCNTEYGTLRQLRAHCRKHQGPFATCHICGKEMREILLRKHLTAHTNAIETCETCGKSFSNITMLRYHQKVHLESVPCPKCKKMINPSRLRRHYKSHSFEENPAMRGAKAQKPHLKCQQCDYITWNNTLLDCHMNRHHLKIKPYVCHICSKDFIGKHLLKKHIENHEFKSVVCMVCLKTFANSTCLKMHLRIHTGEKPFTCEICGDRFRSSSIMNVHKLKKHSDKRNICPLCSNKFHTVRDLRRHLIKVHWKNKNKRFNPRELKGLGEEHYQIFHDGRRVKVSDNDVDFYMPC